MEAIIFDFDGTIIDSSAGIEQAFNKAYQKVYNLESPTRIKSLIGPPIPQVLLAVNGETDPEKVDAFLRYFKHFYDTEDFQETAMYEGMDTVLETMHKGGIKLFIATNKRKLPTYLICEYLSIKQYFTGIYCIDTKAKPYLDKVEMIRDILEREELSIEHTTVVGDTYHDEEAAKQNKLSFVFAEYGFGDVSDDRRNIKKPIEVLNFINEI